MTSRKQPSKRAPARSRGPSRAAAGRKAATAARDASHSRKLLKARVKVLETEVIVLRNLHEALVSEIREMMQGGKKLI